MGGFKRLKLLLDTHIILWSVAEPEKLLPEIVEELENESNELWYSPISVWEIHLLAEKGHILVGSDIEKSIRDIFQKLPFTAAPINLEVALGSRQVNLPHQDPADRFLAATAVVYDLTLVTADARIIAAEGIPVLSAG
ncbi:MAG: type II toxin-antitoxin system VapC family toxin [Deltaproteobacteria bacterium]|jgi:PIN domain nuclease of toxin-antitoxin system|nr:type II toxin-antitoxin system VapC family toxin [Deltaproteobacteria bacterium]